jgi:ligand-binding sensor domain-containing protein
MKIENGFVAVITVLCALQLLSCKSTTSPNVKTSEPQWSLVSSVSQAVFSLTVNGSYIFAGTQNGILLSPNNGMSWSASTNGFPPYTSIFTIGVSGSNILASNHTGGSYIAVNNNGAMWTPLTGSLTTNSVYAFATSGGIFFAGTDDGVFRSTDNGISWAPARNGLPPYIAIFCLKGNDSTLFAGTFDSGMYRSTDKGNNWTSVNTGLPKAITYSTITDLVIDSGNVVAATQDQGVFLSINNGATWSAVNSGLTDRNITSLAVSGKNLFAGSYTGGIFLSTDHGISWVAKNSGLPSNPVYALIVSGTNLFAGAGYGIWLLC